MGEQKKECRECGAIKTLSYAGLCRVCWNRARAIRSEVDQEMSPQISVELTRERFGYDPRFLAHKSGRKVVAICVRCGEERIIVKRSANQHPRCKRCSGQENVKVLSANRRVYLNVRERKKANSRRQYATPLGYLSLILRTGLRLAMQKKNFEKRKPWGCFRLLGYTKEDFLAHIKNCLKEGCVICGGRIEDKWHLAHLKPRSSAKSLEEVYQLFQLNNLSVAHPKCNIKLGAVDITERKEIQRELFI